MTTGYLSWTRAVWPFLAAVFLGAMIAVAAHAGTVVLDDRDWRGPDVVARADGVEHKLTSALLLYTEMAEPVFLFDPTEDETITTITDFQGKLYLGSCTQPAATRTGSVFTYDPETHAWEKVFQVNEEGLVRLEVYGDRLYIPGYDADDGDWDLGNIYVHDGETWVEHRTVPRAVHIYGLAVCRDRIYVSADIFDEPPPGKSVEEAAEEGLPIYGRVVSSGDGGLTWREDYRGPEEGQDVGFMTVFDEKLVLNAHGDLLLFDGTSWDRLGLSPNALVVLDYASAGEALLLGTSVGLCVFDGEKLHPLDTSWGMGTQVRAIGRFGPRWFVACDFITGATLRHGPGGTGYMYLKGEEEKPFASWVNLIPDLRFRAAVLLDKDAQREIDEHRPEERAHWIHSEEMIVSAQPFKGRLFLGTHPEGRVLVLPVVTEGTLEAAPRAIAEPGEYVLSWEAATPPGTSCGLQVRSAPDLETLAQRPFAGPGGDARIWFEAPGAAFEMPTPGFVQYRVALKTEDPALTPYLKRVVIRRAD